MVLDVARSIQAVLARNSNDESNPNIECSNDETTHASCVVSCRLVGHGPLFAGSRPDAIEGRLPHQGTGRKYAARAGTGRRLEGDRRRPKLAADDPQPGD